MLLIDAHQLENLLDFPSLIPALAEGFRTEIVTPQRHHHDFEKNSTLLLMPAWQTGGYLGVKLITMNPDNQKLGLPSIHGLYMLFNSETGEPLAQIDAPALTNLRTAAASALAAKFLARLEARTFLMVGTGSLAPYLIQAHASVRNYTKLQVWGRGIEKARALAEGLKGIIEVEVVEDLAKAVAEADVISVATLSKNPLILGEWLTAGAHLDLVGSYKPDMREADDFAIKRAALFIDTEHALLETGDLRIPLAAGVIQEKAIRGTILQLCRQECEGRSHEDEITVFKSVGHASEDLIAGILAYQRYAYIR